MLIAESVIGEELSYTIVDKPLHGVLLGTAPQISYIPKLDYYGLDTFTFMATNNNTFSNIAEIRIVINQVIDPPIANNQYIVTSVNASVGITLTGNHVDGEELEFEIIDYPVNGVLTGNIPHFIYKPNYNYIGTDYFTFIARTQSLISNQGSISLSIVTTNDMIKQDEDESNCFIMTINY
ncbi:MAG: hypothetical protein OMM_03038 [Candidatus Magnetoglobus multicellularis str. Araruama]|uniref:Uncharacterized protein n=1 Tax=Candidatus Magnetoglobus multicellularis str. Araruama TaxID=890399 RepID=A0A1V1P740_9BACT|nr:MAG: hypothetical protein OMM_03038 [Candidatus Magnetoglobus multicellularis str. Araruama]